MPLLDRENYREGKLMQLTKFIQSYTSKLYLIERRKIDNNRSRREFLSFFRKITLVFAIPIALPVSNKTKDEEEYVFINGWLLKKKDLNDI